MVGMVLGERSFDYDKELESSIDNIIGLVIVKHDLQREEVPLVQRMLGRLKHIKHGNKVIGVSHSSIQLSKVVLSELGKVREVGQKVPKDSIDNSSLKLEAKHGQEQVLIVGEGTPSYVFVRMQNTVVANLLVVQL